MNSFSGVHASSIHARSCPSWNRSDVYAVTSIERVSDKSIESTHESKAGPSSQLCRLKNSHCRVHRYHLAPNLIKSDHPPRSTTCLVNRKKSLDSKSSFVDSLPTSQKPSSGNPSRHGSFGNLLFLLLLLLLLLLRRLVKIKPYQLGMGECQRKS